MALNLTDPRTLGGEYNLSFGSGLKQKMTSVEQMKAGANPTKTLQLAHNVFPTEGFGQHPVVPDGKDILSADFYRYGSNQVRANGDVVNIGANVQAKSLDEFDDRPASIRMYGKGKEKTDKDLIPPFTKFILEGVREQHVERSQIIETFGDFYAFFFGERPSMFSYSGQLINAKNANWVQDFMFYYEHYLRGTRCVESNARIVLTYGGRQVEGFIMNVSHQTMAATEHGVPFSFEVLIIDRKILGVSNDFGLVLENGKIGQNKAFLDAVGKSGVSVPDVSAAFAKTRKVLNNEDASSSYEMLKSKSGPAMADQFKLAVGPVGGSLALGT